MGEISTKKTIIILHYGGDQIRGSEVCLIHAIDAIAKKGYDIVLLRKDSCLDNLISENVRTIIDEVFPEIMFDGSYHAFPFLKYFKSLFRLYRIAKKIILV